MIWHKRAFPLEAIILCALILSETLALYKSFTYLLTYEISISLQLYYWWHSIEDVVCVC